VLPTIRRVKRRAPGSVPPRVQGPPRCPAIATGGAGFGLQISVQVTEFVLVLNTPDAVDAFAHGGNVAIGADLSAAAGPLGRNLRAEVMPLAAIYTYSLSQGLFAGASLEGTVVVTLDADNEAYDGRPVTPRAILSGRVQPPPATAPLHRALARLAAP
jgi:lipid-binding SYLF domain-containing protein